MQALIGPSGSGKSTVLRSIAGAYRPQTGTVRIGDQVWMDSQSKYFLAPHRRAVGMVFQNYALFPHMTALENIMAAISDGQAPGRRRKAAELLELVHLTGLGGRRPAQLSGGQQQRVAVARALARNPRVLLLDEPFSAVDQATRRRLYLEIAELRRALDMPIILVTHDLDEAIMLADSVTVIHHGRTLQTGKIDEVTVRPQSADVARLLNLRNIFTGRVVEQRPEQGLTVIDWDGRRLEAASRPAFSPGEQVDWVVPEGFIVLHQRVRPSRGERENAVPGVVESALTTGPITHVTLRPDGAPHPLHFSVPTHVALRNGLANGALAAVSLLGKGIHLMPPAASIAADAELNRC
jgi:molybdate transport system ATP-binding protein